MSTAKLPLKFSVFKCVAEAEKPISAKDIMDMLECEYRSERQFSKKRIELYLTALSCVSMIHETDFDLDQNGDVLISYKLSDLGRNRTRYLPKAK